ncbi:hypothetical protein INS90_04730 [Trueperella pecoris]|uniref:Uncharacterized protein n=1 Tax=Trueperella pecoris TaxID=2733571 RepID=A0A7M1R4I0_9ACTO|nr:hypothetical protein [Trueperella pecoris]QOR48564.1 hypothetical protein INS90_04730 [Trueperella pecoris]
MTLHFLEPRSLAERHEARSLVREGLMIDIGGIGYIGVDLCRTAADRARLLALSTPGMVFVRETALFIHTGWHTPYLQDGIDTLAKDVLPAGDVVIVGSQLVTSLERTAIDLLTAREDKGIELLCLLVRAGTSVDRIAKRAQELRIHGIVRVREILRQLPHDLGVVDASPIR